MKQKELLNSKTNNMISLLESLHCIIVHFCIKDNILYFAWSMISYIMWILFILLPQCTHVCLLSLWFIQWLSILVSLLPPNFHMLRRTSSSPFFSIFLLLFLCSQINAIFFKVALELGGTFLNALTCLSFNLFHYLIHRSYTGLLL